MRITVHPRRIEDDIVLDLAADLVPNALKAVPERRWVADNSDRGGHSELTGNDLKDGKGNTLYSLRARAALSDGTPLTGVYVQVRSLANVLPARVPLRPTGDVSLEISTSGRGSVTITCDTVEPITQLSNGNHAKGGEL